MMPMNTNTILDKERDQDLFESVTEEEIIYLWRSIKGRGISEDEAWHAVVTGLALDMAFAKTKTRKQIEH
jgi:Fe-S cluster assembly scaffold protein SufB